MMSNSRTEYLKKYRNKNKEMLRLKHKEWRDKNKEHVKLYSKQSKEKYKENIKKGAKIYNRSEKRLNVLLKHYYKITLIEYNNILKKQNGVCAACFEPESLGERLSVDHNHKCCPGGKSCGKCVRALLCRRCNSVLGLCKDSKEILNKLIEYVEVNNEAIHSSC